MADTFLLPNALFDWGELPEFERGSKIAQKRVSQFESTFLRSIVMNAALLPLKRCFVLRVSILLACTPVLLSAQDLESLLNPSKADLISDDASAREEWEAVVDAFRRSDFTTAAERGRAFLKASHEATPYQVLGVQVMLALASGEAVALESLAEEEKAELDRLRDKQDRILAEARTQRNLYQEADELIIKLTKNRTIGVQQGSLNHQKCILAQKQMDDAASKLETLERENEAIKIKLGSQVIAADEGMKGDVIRLLGMLKDSQEIPAAYAICNVYLRKFGPDLDVAKFQDDFSRLQKIHDRAVQVVELIRQKQKPLVEEKRYWSAAAAAEDILVKVDTQSDGPELPVIVRKLMQADPLEIESNQAGAMSESAAILELARIDGAKARGEFSAFETRYPDYPELASLRIAILGEETMDRKEMEEALVKEIESLVAVSPEKALRTIGSIEPDSLSAPEKLRLKVRVTAAASQVIDQMLATLESDIHSAISIMGGAEWITKFASIGEAEWNDSSGSAAFLGELRSRIDRSRDIPEAIATLKSVIHTSENLLALDLDDPQNIQLSRLKLKAKLLLEAAEG